MNAPISYRPAIQRLTAFSDTGRLLFLRHEGKAIAVNFSCTDDEGLAQMKAVNKYPLHLEVDASSGSFIFSPHFGGDSRDIWTFSFNPTFPIHTVRTGEIYLCTEFMARATRFIAENGAQHIEGIAQNILREALAIAGLVKRSTMPDERLTQSLHLTKKIVEENVEEDLSLRLLCRKTGLNEFKLKKGFRTLFQVSVMEYHLRLKMERAKKLLLETDESVSTIAFTIGYEFAHNFSQAFKLRFGCTPREFRRMGSG